MFNQLMKQVSALTVDTEERLKGVIDLVFEKAIDEPSFSVAYANMCRCLVTVRREEAVNRESPRGILSLGVVFPQCHCRAKGRILLALLYYIVTERKEFCKNNVCPHLWGVYGDLLEMGTGIWSPPILLLSE